MQAIALISKTVQPLAPGDPVSRALDLMEEFRTDVLPVVSGNRLVGLMKAAAAQDHNGPDAKVGNLMDQVEIPYVRDRQHFYDVLNLMAVRNLSLVPVLDMGGRYLGVVGAHEAVRQMALMANVAGPGSVVVLEMARNEYALQQIARIVEEEGARILSMFCTDVPESARMEVTLKINREDISAILQAFDRHEYSVHTTFQGSRLQDDLRTRYEDVMRIIKM